MDENKPEAPLSEEEVTANEPTASNEEVTANEPVLSEEEAERREKEALEAADGDDFAARYQASKERELKKLTQEIEEQSQINTKKKKWKTALKFIFLAALIGLSIGLMFGLGDYIHGDKTLGFVAMLKETFNWRYFLVFVAAVVAFIFFESLKYSYLLKISTGKWRLKNSVKVMFLGKYYDGITPLGTGGQPFQIYYLHKRNVPAGAATAVPLVKYIVSTFVFGILSAVFLGLAPSQFESNSAVLGKLTLSFMIIAWFGVVFHLLVPTAMVLLSAFPKVGKKIIAWIVKVLHKMHIVKRKYSATKKYVYEISEYRNALKLLIRKWYKLIPLLLIAIVAAFLHLTMPFYAVLAIAGNTPDVVPSGELLVQIMCLSAVSFYSATLVPTPGNSGASETTTFFVFSTIAGIGSVVGWVVFAWRFTSFYLYIIVGVCMTVFSMIRDGVRARRQRKLQNEK